jgi:hypothetical protein
VLPTLADCHQLSHHYYIEDDVDRTRLVYVHSPEFKVTYTAIGEKEYRQHHETKKHSPFRFICPDILYKFSMEHRAGVPVFYKVAYTGNPPIGFCHKECLNQLLMHVTGS